MTDSTDITIILDRSGSMESVKSDTIGGFNTFLKDQQEIDKPASLSLVQFDNHYESVYLNKPIKEAEKLTETTFQPRGSTALYYAIGRTINSIGQRLSDLSENERPGNVLVVIMTDGHENSSHEFTAQKINEMITHQQDAYNWQFVFVGANQDAILSARTMGIRDVNAMTYAANAGGVRAMMASVSHNVKSYRQTGRSQGLSFTKEQRQKQEDALKK